MRACQQRHGQALAALARQACADFLSAADAAWSARWLPDHEDLERAFDDASQRGDADVAADIIETLVLGAHITCRTEPALQRWQATRAHAEPAAPLARAKLLGWGNLAQVAGTTRLAQSAQRQQAWQQVAGEDGQRGLCVALAMHAVVCQDSGDTDAADAALAECLALESPDWPPRLRRRCARIALTRLAITRIDDALLARAGRLSARLAAELQQQGAWREHTLVQGQQALVLRLRGQARAAAELLAQVARTQLQLGCGIDAGRRSGGMVGLNADLRRFTPTYAQPDAIEASAPGRVGCCGWRCSSMCSGRVNHEKSKELGFGSGPVRFGRHGAGRADQPGQWHGAGHHHQPDPAVELERQWAAELGHAEGLGRGPGLCRQQRLGTAQHHSLRNAVC